MISDANESEAHQWGKREVETALAVFEQILLKHLVLALLVEATPIQMLEIEPKVAVDNLQRLLAFLPDEGRAEDGVAIDDLLPRSLERFDVQALAKVVSYLHHIDIGLIRVQTMKKYPFLDGREGINSFDVFFNRSSSRFHN
jgi:hypothetical protein